MSRKSRHGRRQPPAGGPRQRQDSTSPRLVALPVPGVVQLADGTSGGGKGRIIQSSAQSTSTAISNQQQLWSQPTGRPYPPMDKISPDKPLLKSLGATGTAIFSGIITSEEYNSDFYWKDAIQIYEQMIRNDAQVFAMTQLLELPIRRATWSIEPASDQPRDKEIASFVETCLFHEMRYTTSEGRTLTQKWDDILRHILMMLRFGFMCFEKVYRIEDGWTKWARWTPLLPRTVWRWWVGEDNELVGVQQWTFKDYTYQFVDIPADKLLLFVHRQEGNNYEGVSVLRSAYKHWYYKDNFYKIEAIDIERNAAEIPAIYLPENFTQEDLNNAQNVLANMRVNEQMGVTMPPGWRVEYIRTYGRNTASVQPSIQHHDIMIARNILGQFLNLGSSETGSYALAQEQTATFLAALQAECEYIEDVINSDAIPELVNYNFTGVEVYPKLKASKVLAQDFDAIADALNKLTSAPSGPLIHGDPELEDFLRNELGLPKAPKSAVESTNPSAPSTPDRPETQAADDATGDGDHATEQSQDQQPTAQQEATSQAIANGAPNANTASGQVQESGTAAQELTVEARLLREALDAAYGQDAVERGLTFSGHQPGYTQNRGPGGRWGPGDGGESESGGGVHAPHDIGTLGIHARGASGGGGGGGARAKAPKTTEEKLTAARERLARAQQEHERVFAAYKANPLRKGAEHEMSTAHEERAKAEKYVARLEKQEAAATATKAATAAEGLHERSARLQREQGLRAEVRPGEHIQVEHYLDPKRFGPDQHGERMVSALKEAYGEHQLGAVLARYPFSELRLAAKDYGIKSGTSKDEALSRITAFVTEGRYSANFGGGKGAGVPKGTGGTRSRSAKSEDEASRTTGKSAREQELERQVASLKAERDALKAGQQAEGTTAKAVGGARASKAAKAEEPNLPEPASPQGRAIIERTQAEYARLVHGRHDEVQASVLRHELTRYTNGDVRAPIPRTSAEVKSSKARGEINHRYLAVWLHTGPGADLSAAERAPYEARLQTYARAAAKLTEPADAEMNRQE